MNGGVPNASFADLLAWYDVNNPASLNGGAGGINGAEISELNDLSPNGHDLTGGISKPIFRDNIINGNVDALEFDGSRFLTGPNTNVGSPKVIFVVVEVDPAGNDRYVFDGLSSGNRNAFFTGQSTNPGNWSFFHGSSAHDSPVAVVSSIFQVHTIVINTNSMDHYINGTLASSDSGVANGNWQMMTLGARFSQNQIFRGHIAEMLIYDAALSNGDRQDVENYLRAKISPTPTINAFCSDPGNINANDPVELSWDVENFTSLSIDNGVGNVTAISNIILNPGPAVLTTYTLTATNANGSIQSQVGVFVGVATLNPIITEFMASNTNTLLDEDGDSSDWIEIYNPNPFSINLDGWYLTDDSGDLTKWMFPDTLIKPRSFLVVFASDKNRTVSGNELHTSFKLTSNGEYLGLVQSDGTSIASQYSPTFPQQFEDISYGEGNLYFLTPTPGAANNSGSPGFLGFVDEPAFSVDRGFYDSSFSLVLTTTTPGTTIYYTTDGSVPTISSTQFSGSIPIISTTVIRAFAVATNYGDSTVGTHTYIFPAAVLTQTGAGLPTPTNPSVSDWDYEMDPNVVTDPQFSPTIENDLKSLPVLCLALPAEDMWGSSGIYNNPTQSGFAWERVTSVELIESDGSSAFQEDAGIRIQGAGSRFRNLGKKSFRLKFRSDYGASKLDYPVFGGFGPDRFDGLVLRGNYFDTFTVHTSGSGDGIGYNNSLYMRDTFGVRSHRAMGRTALLERWAHIYINGIYWGIYNITERPDEDFAAEHFGGSAENYDVLKQRPRGQPNGSPPEVVQGDLVAWNNLLSLIANDMTVPANYAAAQQYIEIPRFIDYILLNIWGGNSDWPHNNWYAFRRRDVADTFHFLAWDTENFMFGLNVDRTGVSTNNSPGVIYSRLILNEEFRVAFGDRVQKHMFNNGALTVAQNISRLQILETELVSAMNTESARWGDTRTEPPLTTIFPWQDEINDRVTNYLPQRHNIVLTQLRNDGLYPNVDAPTYNQHGGSVPIGFNLTMTNPNGSGTVYYTLDGSDVRLPGGAISGSAQIYGAGVTLNNTATVLARVLDAGEWSAANCAVFDLPSSSPLRITEIHYHPGASTQDEINAGYTNRDQFEFIELRNIGISETINLIGYNFSEGIKYDFTSTSTISSLAPGEYVLLVDDAAAFAFRYGVLPTNRIAGQYSGRLDNDGEQIILQDDGGNVIHDFEYNDNVTLNWPLAADGSGPSLEVVNTEGNYSDGLNWTASSEDGGTPAGFTKPDPPAQPSSSMNIWQLY